MSSIAIEVEQPVTQLPPHGSRRAELPHRALQYCSLRIQPTPYLERMTDMWFYYPKILEQFTKACPRITFMLAAPVELLE